MKTTITDVAKQAGVSMKTVSRVLNNEPNVAKATRDRVMEVASQLQYTPNLAARGLASSKSYLIALLYDNASPSYITHVQRGAIEACRENEYHLLLEPITLAEAEGSDLERRLRRTGVDGVILTPPLSDSLRLRMILKSLNLNYVLIGAQNPENAKAVRMDDDAAAFQMTRYLIEEGHTKIGFIKGPPEHGASTRRLSGFMRAMKSQGLVLNVDWIMEGDFSFRSGVKVSEVLLKTPHRRPTAIFASNDDMAAGVISVAGRLGVQIPDDLSVCGFDDTPIAQIIWPQMTTVAQPIRQMGYKSASMLTSRTQTDDINVCELDFELKIRGSTAGPR